MAKKRILTLELHEGSEMARLREGRHELHFGNYWDFHAGCQGTEMLFKDGTIIDFEKQWNDSIRRPLPVAEMVAREIGAEVVVVKREKPFRC